MIQINHITTIQHQKVLTHPNTKPNPISILTIIIILALTYPWFGTNANANAILTLHLNPYSNPHLTLILTLTLPSFKKSWQADKAGSTISFRFYGTTVKVAMWQRRDGR